MPERESVTGTVALLVVVTNVPGETALIVAFGSATKLALIVWSAPTLVNG